MANYSQPFPTVIDAFIKALEHALPERITGAHFGTFSGVHFRGKRDDGTPFDCHDSGHGDWGACATHDSAGPFRTMAHGDTRIIPVELQESTYPIALSSLGCVKIPAAPAGFAADLAIASDTKSWATATSRRCSIESSIRRGECTAAKKANPNKSP
jgi:N-methylhydantoinase B/oxoprolinase/acetone carboxylase alpha subunit